MSSQNVSPATAAVFHAVAFNNEGVRMMDHSRYDDAVTSFSSVLETLNPVVSCSRAEIVIPSSQIRRTENRSSPSQLHPTGDTTSSVEESPRDKQFQTPQHQCPVHACACLQATKEPAGHFVFRDPIEIPIDAVPATEEPSEKLVNKFVVVVMYNLALAVHLTALNRNSNTTDLSRARKLYELAFQMHLEESCDVTLLFSLALMNNLGLIYHALGEEERAQTCFRNMLSTMMYLLESDEAKTISQWDGLLTNVMDRVFKGQNIAAPAA